MDDMAVTASVRRCDGRVVKDLPWNTVSVDLLGAAAPWRTFRWHKDQKHYSGTYWSATTHGHVIYESRLELARLLFADFDPAVRGIVAQPFLLKALVEGKARKHIPDYFLITEHGPVVVDVKPGRRPIRQRFRLTRRHTGRTTCSGTRSGHGRTALDPNGHKTSDDTRRR